MLLTNLSIVSLLFPGTADTVKHRFTTTALSLRVQNTKSFSELTSMVNTSWNCNRHGLEKSFVNGKKKVSRGLADSISQQ